jgi:hypothetical protein
MAWVVFSALRRIARVSTSPYRRIPCRSAAVLSVRLVLLVRPAVEKPQALV